MSQVPSVTSAPETVETNGFWEWIKALPARYQLLSVAAAALAAVVPKFVIPEPLDALRTFGTLIVVVAFLLTWAEQKRLRKHVRRVIVATNAVLVLLVVLHLVFVKPVRWRNDEPGNTSVETEWFVTGWNVIDPSLRGMTAEDQIRTTNGGWDELRGIWGTSFVVVALTYSILYLGLLNGLVLSLGGTDFAQQRPRTRRTGT